MPVRETCVQNRICNLQNKDRLYKKHLTAGVSDTAGDVIETNVRMGFEASTTGQEVTAAACLALLGAAAILARLRRKRRAGYKRAGKLRRNLRFRAL
jgi:hypothetical protein